jgi:predicted acylesterase/phospholipase RssA
MNGVLMEVGFLRRLRESALWPRIGWVFGTSSGALSGCMAALDRLGALEEFLLDLRPEETFRPNRLWRLPLLGTHDYVLPRTIADRLGDPVELAHELARAERELVVLVTDVTMDADAGAERRLFERAYSSRATVPELMADAVLASAAVSALVLPRPVGDRVATDGGWVRNYPLGYAYERPEVQRIVAFRYEPRYPQLGAGALRAAADRLRRYSRLPAARALVRELDEATAREERGEPAHALDTFVRLSRVAILRNTALEELRADERDQAIAELAALRDDVLALVSSPAEREAVAERFAAARFPFRHERLIPRITAVGSAGETSLEYGFRRVKPWTREVKRRLIDEGWALADAALRRHAVA